MLFPEEHAPLLKAWIVKRLENTSDADADVLADYVLALLRHEGTSEDVKKLCEAEIPDFLKEDSSVFVSDVFDAIHFKSYLPGAPPPPKRSFVQPGQAKIPQPQGLPVAPPLPPPPAHVGSKKRSYQERGEVDAPNGRDAHFTSGRTYKQPRRHVGHAGRGARADDRRGPAAVAFQNSGFQQAHFAPSNPGLPHFDRNNPLDAILNMQAMGIPVPPMPDYAPSGGPARMGQPARRRQRCRDYDEKGYCARGNSCMFQHGPETLYIPPPAAQPPPVQQPPTEEYDPTNANIFPAGFPTQAGPLLPHPDGGSQMSEKRQGGGQKRRNRAPFSADGPVTDRSKSTIVVESIPEENFSEEEVRGFFSQYGNILEVSMQPYKRLAIVKFESWGAAQAAWKSPKVIFDNRFVKVFWYKDDASKLPPSAPLNGGVNGKKTGAANGHGSVAMAGSPASGDAEIDMEEFTRKQDEAQKAHEDKLQKMQELERQKRELDKRQKELWAKQQEEKQRLHAKLASSPKAGAADPANAITADGTDGAKAASRPTSQTEALRAQLAALEEEAKQLGLDPNAPDETSYWSPRGGRGPGRAGLFRGRGFSPRGFRGFGGRANAHAAYAAYSLDNRPRKIAVSGVDFTVPEKDELLRQYLLGIGEFTDIETTPAGTTITFKDRKTAEKFFYGLGGKEIPGIDGQVELAWVTGSVPTTAAGFVSANGAEAQGRKGGADDAVMGGVADSSVSAVNDHHHHDHSEMDYDVADENEWGIN